MNLRETIRALYAERDRIQRTIAAIEALRDSDGHIQSPGRRGRKSMGASERREVSARMKKYWAKRRKQRERAAPAPMLNRE